VITLLPDQADLINNVKDKVRGGSRAILLQGATGSGKSCMASDIVNGAYRKGKTCHFIVPRRDLIRQTSETFNAFGIPHGFIASGLKQHHRNKIFVCSAQTLINRLDIPPDLAIIDETHYGSAGLDKIIKFYKSRGTVIVGLSATPWKLSGQGLGCWYDEMVCGPSIRWLIDNKRLADYRAFAPSHPDLGQIKIVGGDFAKGQLSERMEGDRVLIGNAVKHYKQHAMGKLGVTFGVSRKHSEMLAQEFRDNGVPAMHMDGETPDDERKRICVAFAKRELLQITNCDLLNFGFDLSSASGIKGVNIQCLTDCKPTKSLAAQMQKNGRNMRYDPEPHLFFDHANSFQEHGLPCADRVWTLEDREKGSKDAAEKSISVRQCLPAEDADGVVRGCYYCHKPAPICPNCLRVYKIESREIEQVDGELQELQIQQQKKQERQKQGRAATLEELIEIGKSKGYRFPVQWAKKVMAGRRR
jgi:superfamily II DNA or RNA helicase